MSRKRYNYSKLFRDIYNFSGYTYNEIDIGDDVVNISLKRTTKTGRCRKCGKRNSLQRESYKRTVRDYDLGPKQCFITFTERRIHCKCGYRGFEHINFVRPNARSTKRFEEYVFILCEKMTVKDTADITSLDWKTIKDIDKHYIKRRIRSLENITPRRIGVDEVAYLKGHKYLTIVRDLDLNAVIWIGINRKKETLDEFFDEIGELKQRMVEVAVVDMWDPYIASIKRHCPFVDIVFDKFHIVKKANEALDKIRKMQFALAEQRERLNMKRKRFILLKRNCNLSEHQRERLDELVKKNDVLYKSYLLKEQILDIFDENDLETALKRLDEWIRNVNDSGIEPFKRMIKTLNKYFYGIRNYFIHKVTNAGSEGFNTKINVLRRKAYGFSDLEYFMLKIYQACGVMRLGVT